MDRRNNFITRTEDMRTRLKRQVVISFIFCSWLIKVYVLDYPCLLIIRTTPLCTITSDNREYNVYESVIRKYETVFQCSAKWKAEKL